MQVGADLSHSAPASIPNVEDFPADEQPVTETAIKAMLLSLQTTLHRDLYSKVIDIKDTLNDHSSRITYIEN